MTTRGIVLKKINYEESSVIMSVLTVDGVISLMARYVKKGLRQYLPLTEPLTEISFDATKSKDMYYLKSGELVDPFSEIKSNLDEISIANIILEYSHLLSDAISNKKSYYDLVLLSLSSITSSADPEIPLFKYLILLTKLLGITLKKDHLRSVYLMSDTCMASLEALFNGEKIEERSELRLFFRSYFQNEMGVNPKSYDFYLSLFKE